jgi:UDP-N-acetylmuramate--alanine ligase
VVAAARAARPALDCAYVPDRHDLAKHVAATMRPGDLVITLGAGDITTLADELVELLAAAPEEATGGGAP